MRLKLAIENGDKHFNNMSAVELVEFQQLVVGLPPHEHSALYDKVMLPAVPALQASITEPDWLKSDFRENVWQGHFGKTKKEIDFNVVLEDGSSLTDASNSKLLYTFKYWICAVTHPIYNGGQFLKNRSYYGRVTYILQFIDAFLLRSSYLQLSKYGLGLVDLDTCKAIITSATLVRDLYSIDIRLTDYLKKHAAEVSDNDIAVMAAKYPSILELPSERILNLSDKELIKARVLLVELGAYSNPSSTQKYGNCRITFIKNLLNENTLHGKAVYIDSYHELRVTPSEQLTEYRAVPIASVDETDGTCRKTLVEKIRHLKSIHLISGDQFAGTKADLSDLTFDSIAQTIKLRQIGRFRTLPASEVFTSLKNAFEFSLEFSDDILKSIAGSAINNHMVARKKNLARDTLAISYCTPKLLNFGVQRWRLVSKLGVGKADGYFTKLRNNMGLVELYEVLLGSIQIIIGTLMARRVSELLELSSDCLHPKTDPNLPENADTGYFIDFYNRKSGAGEDRENLKRPIILVGAKLIWKLQDFRKKLVEAEVVNRKAGLFLCCNAKSNQFGTGLSSNYANNFDRFCDYFETKTINFLNAKPHRYYIRQHQLRRFFAMTFFWGSGFDGLDTLRYFLGHTDAEHLYHYITENTPGVVLRGVKAETLVHGLNSGKIAGIEKLRELLKERFNVSDVTIEALDDAVDELKEEVAEGYLSTEPQLEKVRQQLELDVEFLLDEGVINLEPKFFTVTDDNGETSQEIQLVLIVRDSGNE